MDAVVDAWTLILAVVIALVITAALLLAQRGDNHRRGWLTAATLIVVLSMLSILDLLRAPQRDVHLSTAVVGAMVPVFGALGIVRGTRPVRPQLRWLIVFLVAFVLLFAGLLVGATLGSRLLPF